MLVIAGLVVTTGAMLALVLGPVLRDVLEGDGVTDGLALSGGMRRALWTSAWIGLVIAMLATVLGWCLAGPLARGGWRAGLMLLPTLVPVYLAYAGWGQLRAPGTWLGDHLLTLSSAGHHEWVAFTGKAFAVLGLALWAAPIAGLVLAAGVRRRGRAFEESLALDNAGWRARFVERLRFHRFDALGALALVWAVMIGSAVPLHVASPQSSRTLAMHVRTAELKRVHQSPPSWWPT